MGGFFGAVSHRDIVMDVFFGTDYHSHLGTRNAGMAIWSPNGKCQRQIHSIANTPFRTRFEKDLPDFAGNIGIGCISDSDPQPLLVRSHLGLYAITTVGQINNAEELVDTYFAQRGQQFMAMGSGKVNATELVAALINEGADLTDGIRHAQEMIDGSMTILLLTSAGEIIAARDRMTPMRRGFLSDRVVRNILRSEAFQQARTVMIYRAVRGEVCLQALESQAGGEKRLVYPLCTEDRGLRALRPLDNDAWRPGPFQIPEPDPARSQEIDPAEIDLVLCPCAAFDDSLTRLGMGGGYYDRFLPLCENAVIAAVAFEAQRAEGGIPAKPWDIPMDAVFTEEGVRRRKQPD